MVEIIISGVIGILIGLILSLGVAAVFTKIAIRRLNKEMQERLNEKKERVLSNFYSDEKPYRSARFD